MIAHARLACSALALLLAATLAEAAPRYSSVLIEGVAHVRQKPDFCGEACAEMVLRKLGNPLDQDDVFDQAGLDPLLGRGCHTQELATALKRIGFDIGSVWSSVSVAKAEQDLESQFRLLHADLTAGVPSIVCMRYDQTPAASEHFRLILGYDAKTDEVIYHEPAIDRGDYRRMKRQMFLQLWPLKYDPRQWTIIRMPLRAENLAVTEHVLGQTDADYAQHIRSLKERLPNEDFHIVLQKPFVVVGDESLATLRSRAEGTIQWAVDRLKRDYFSNDPLEIIDIWLFKDKESYDQQTEHLFGSRPSTPFGYYSARHRALVMNISTGGGTLVHEIVHPFMESNFPNCPSWFNEGLASLYEQCRDRDGHIWGSTNWRLRGLHGAIADDSVPPFKTLCETSTREFYDEDPGTNYSQARYLCYYLQQRGLLVKYYHAFRRAVADDPSGYQTLSQILDESDMPAFQKKWERYVTTLRFP